MLNDQNNKLISEYYEEIIQKNKQISELTNKVITLNAQIKSASYKHNGVAKEEKVN